MKTKPSFKARFGLVAALGGMLCLPAGFAPQCHAKTPGGECLGVAAAPDWPVQLVSKTESGASYAWVEVLSNIHAYLVRLDLKSGDTATADMGMLGTGHLSEPVLWRLADSDLLLGFGGKPPKFFEVAPGQGSKPPAIKPIVTEPPSFNASFWAKGTQNGENSFFVGVHPDAQLIRLDYPNPKVTVESLSKDKRQQYVISPVASRLENIVYCPVGVYQSELWAMGTGEGAGRKQIFPAEPARQGVPRIWRAEDGRIYGRHGEFLFECRPDGVVPVASTPPNPMSDLVLEGIKYGRVRYQNKSLTRENAKTGQVLPPLKTDFPDFGATVYSLPLLHNGRLFGSTIVPGHLFAFDLEASPVASSNFGKVAGGQIYDILPLTLEDGEEAFALGIYPAARIGLFFPSDSSHQIIASLMSEPAGTPAEPAEQERPVQLAEGSDRAIYVASRPIKGRLGGALSRIQLKSRKDPDPAITVRRNLIKNQSIMTVVRVPNTSHLFCGSSIEGGTTAVPTETEAEVFLWDTANDPQMTGDPIRISLKGEPLFQSPNPPVRSFIRAISLPPVEAGQPGRVFCLGVTEEGRGRFFVWDGQTRRVVWTGELKNKGFDYPYVNPVTVWNDHTVLLYGPSGIEAVDVNDRTVKTIQGVKADLRGLRGIYASADGTLYYGLGDKVYREKLPR